MIIVILIKNKNDLFFSRYSPCFSVVVVVDSLCLENEGANRERLLCRR